MQNGKLVATVSRVVLGVFLVASLMTGPVNTVYAQAPQVLAPANGAIIDCDPVPGRSVPVTFSWSPFKETTKYKFVVAKDAAMTQVVDEAEVSTTTHEHLHGRPNPLECGTNYFWRVRALEPAPSDWSATFSFTVKPTSMPIPTKDYYGLRLLAPDNGCLGCPVKPASFSWSPFKETTKYKFVLAKDAAMTQVVAEAEVPTTAHEYNGTLDYSTNYFWRVMALEPAPSDWSATFSFQTEGKPQPPSAPPQSPPTPVSPQPASAPLWTILIYQHLEYSPNGKEIVFVQNDGNDPEIYILNVQTREIQQLTNNKWYDCQPAWSKSGKEIAFWSDRDGSWQIYEMNLRTNRTKKLTNFKY